MAVQVRYERRPQALTPAVLTIIILCSALFLFLAVALRRGWIASQAGVEGSDLLSYLCLAPDLVFARGRVWQLVTYIFVHLDLGHVFFNMLILAFMGPRVETRMGTPRFVAFFLGTGAFAGLCCYALSFASGVYSGGALPYFLGASGALFAVMTMWWIWWPDETILLWFIIPIKIKWLMLISVLVGAALLLTQPGGVAHEAHLGGCAAAYLWWRFIESRARGASPPKSGKRPGPKLRLIKGSREQEDRFKAIIDDL